MIAPWLSEILYAEWDWRAVLRRVAAELCGSAEQRARASVEVARALEHVEPDRRFALAMYRHAGPDHDEGRGLELAIELGQWEDVSQLAMVARTTRGSLDALVSEGRALLELGQETRAQRLVPATPSSAGVVALRAELDGGSEAALGEWVSRGEQLAGAASAECFVVAARLARVLGRSDWHKWLEAALRADPGHRFALALLLDSRWTKGRRGVSTLLEVLRQRLGQFDERGELRSWCDATRDAALRLWFSSDAEKVRGLSRRLLVASLERAYQERLPQIPGHLAIWAALDAGAAADGTRVELLRLIVEALDVPAPAHDHVWLAALGSEICSRAGNPTAARAYAVVVAEHAPLHPAAREWFGHATSVPVRSEVELEAFHAALLRLEVADAGGSFDDELQIEDMSTLTDEDLTLGPGGSSAALSLPAEPGRGHTDPELAAALAGVDELVLAQVSCADDAVIADVLAAVDASLRESGEVAAVAGGDHGSSTRERGAARATAVLGSDAAEAWSSAAWIRRGAEPTSRRVLAVGPDPDGPGVAVPRRRATALGPSALELRPPAAAIGPSAPELRPPAAALRPPPWQQARKADTEPWPGARARLDARARPEAGAGSTAASSEPAGAVAGSASGATGSSGSASSPSGAASSAASGSAVVGLIPGVAASALAASRTRPVAAVRGLPVVPASPPPRAEARAAPRTTLPVDLRLFSGEREISMQIRDLSRTGLFAVTEEKLPVGAVFLGELRLPAADLTEHAFEVRVRVVRRTELGLGLELVSPQPALLAALDAC